MTLLRIYQFFLPDLEYFSFSLQNCFEKTSVYQHLHKMIISYTNIF
eukprot:UN26598